MKHLSIITFSLLAFSQNILANATETALPAATPASSFGTQQIILALLGAFLCYAMVKMANLAIRTREIRIYKKYGHEQYIAETQQSWWERFKRTATNAVPLTSETAIILDHDYDGIHELDNDLPPWWLWMFYISIVFGVLYFGYHHVLGYGMNQEEQWEHEMAIAKEQVERYLSTQANLVDETNATALTDATSLEKGKAIFTEYCVACHLADGGGSVGPNLTDNYWLHGGDVKDVFTTIKYGVPEKGMIAWKAQLNAADIHRVTSYVMSLGGTTPAVAKAPQGELYNPGGQAVAPGSPADSTEANGPQPQN